MEWNAVPEGARETRTGKHRHKSSEHSVEGEYQDVGAEGTQLQLHFPSLVEGVFHHCIAPRLTAGGWIDKGPLKPAQASNMMMGRGNLKAIQIDASPARQPWIQIRLIEPTDLDQEAAGPVRLAAICILGSQLTVAFTWSSIVAPSCYYLY